VIKEGYEPLLVQEIMSYFFGIGSSKVPPATQVEQDTFLELLDNEYGTYLALDFLNCWLIERGMPGIPDELLNSVKNFDKIKRRKRNKRKTKKRK